jgi:hypothetical protein
MTSVLYSSGLNYQSGNPVRAEIVAVRREVGELRKQIETLTDENEVYRKYILKLMRSGNDEAGIAEFTRELMTVSGQQLQEQQQQQQQQQQPGRGTVQGAGFRR